MDEGEGSEAQKHISPRNDLGLDALWEDFPCILDHGELGPDFCLAGAILRANLIDLRKRVFWLLVVGVLGPLNKI